MIREVSPEQIGEDIAKAIDKSFKDMYQEGKLQGGREHGLCSVFYRQQLSGSVHHKQVQVLICVAGRGWYQEWGKPAVEMTPSTVIAIPAEVKHWHGAAKDSWFQHLTYHRSATEKTLGSSKKDVKEDASNEWLEPVTDEIYNKLP